MIKKRMTIAWSLASNRDFVSRERDLAFLRMTPLAPMSREFSLVLLASSILTASDVVYGEDHQAEAKAEEQARQQVACSHRRIYPGALLSFHAGGDSNNRSVSAASAPAKDVRRGLGNIGRIAAGS